MNDDNVDMEDLDAFSDALFGAPEKEAAPKEEEKVEVDENEDTPLATEDDEDEPQEEDEGDDLQEEEEPEPKPEEKKKSKFQTRIDELVTEARVAQRERDALRQELEALRARSEVKPQTEDLREKLPSGAPSPDAVDDKGEPLYPLGEFDPRFIADITRFTITQQMEAEKESRLKAEMEQKRIQEQTALKAAWEEKVADYTKDNPDYSDNIRALGVAFSNLDQQYGEYLSTVLMECDNGPAVMDYLSQNIGEAQKIVASGAHAATLAIGRLDARFEKATEEAPKQRTRMSDAPPPPESRVRGKGGQFAVRPDTDDLDAFSKEFFK